MHSRALRVAVSLSAAGAAAVAFLGSGRALADPNPTVPGTPITGVTDDTKLVAGVGADADAELVDAIVDDYNNRPSATDPRLESFDAVNPQTGAAGEQITTKPGCALARPNGANAGATALLAKAKATGTGGDGTSLCVDFARMSRAKKTDGSEATLDFYALATDAVTWAAVTGSYAPATLSKAQLKDIFECTDTNWSQVGGQAGPIHVYVPPASAATYTFFLQAIGSSVANVTTGCGSAAIATQQNDGTKLLGDPEAIAPYAIGKWASQSNVESDANIKVRDVRGGTVLGSATAATGNPYVSPTSTLSGYLVNNPSFTAAFTRTLFTATLNTGTPSYFPSGLADAVFGTTGFVCTDPGVQSVFARYGFTPLSAAACGQKS
jgi:ABC-type phosphate transport system substrate-binding protein